MRHLRKGRKLNRTSAHRKALMRNLATSLFEHKKIETTEAKAKELRSFAERLITKAKNALAKEKQGLLPDGQTIDIHNRRRVARDIQNKAVLQELFDAIAPVVEDRAGGYTRVIKTGFRRGDSGRTAIIELVDWAAPVDGATSIKSKRKRKKQAKKPDAKPVVEEQEELTSEEVTVEEITEDAIEETTEDAVVVEEAPLAEEEQESAEATASEETSTPTEDQAPAGEDDKADDKAKES